MCYNTSSICNIVVTQLFFPYWDCCSRTQRGKTVTSLTQPAVTHTHTYRSEVRLFKHYDAEKHGVALTFHARQQHFAAFNTACCWRLHRGVRTSCNGKRRAVLFVFWPPAIQQNVIQLRLRYLISTSHNVFFVHLRGFSTLRGIFVFSLEFRLIDFTLVRDTRVEIYFPSPWASAFSQYTYLQRLPINDNSCYDDHFVGAGAADPELLFLQSPRTPYHQLPGPSDVLWHHFL